MAVAADNVADSEPDDFEAVVAGEFHIVDNVAAPGCFEGSVAVAVEVAFDAADADIHTADAIPALVAEFHALLADNVVEVELVDADSVDAADSVDDAAAAEVEAGTPVKSVGEARNSFVAG